MGSQRLPGKSLAMLGEWTILGWVLQRLIPLSPPHQIVVSTTEEAEDDAICDEAHRHGIRTSRGPTDDLFERFRRAPEAIEYSHVVRVCADNPFVSAEFIRHPIHTSENVEADYIYNHAPASVQHVDGLGAEIITRSYFQKLLSSKLSAEEREHMTYAFRSRTSGNRIRSSLPPDPLFLKVARLEVDTNDDLLRARHVVSSSGLTPKSADSVVVSSFLREARLRG